MTKESVFFEVVKIGQSPKCLLFPFVSLLFLHCALHFPICLEIPPKKLYFCERLSSKRWKRLVRSSHHPYCHWSEERPARGKVFKLPLCFQVSSGTSRVKPSSYLCFLLSTKGPGRSNHNMMPGTYTMD